MSDTTCLFSWLPTSLPPSNFSPAAGYTIGAQNGTAAAAACGTGMLAGLTGPVDLPAAAGCDAGAGQSLTRRVQSCQLPASFAGNGSMASQQEFARSASVSFGVNCGGSGVNFSGARVSVSGSGSGSGTGFAFEELAAKRGCYEPSINNSGSDGSNPAEVTGFLGFYGSSGMGMVAAEQQQQQQGPQAAQLGAWFASQQRQQQQLQLQMQANLQLQQQVQMQIQHQVAAHMSMQQAAGQVLQLQQPSLSSPYAGIGSPVAAAAPAGFAVMPADLGSPFASAGAYNTSRTAAAAAAAAAMAAVAANAANAANTGVPYQQLQQLQDLRLRQSASPVAAAGDAAADSTMQVQQQVVQPGTGFGSTQASHKPCDHVVPEVDTQGAEPQQQQQQAAAAAPAGAFRVPQLSLQVPASSMQPTPAADEIDSLLTKAGRDMFELDDLAAAAGIDGIDGIEGMEEMDAGAIAAACGLESGGDALRGDNCSSGNNSSLCESMADELAVAGLEAQDAAGYYMFGGAGSPRQAQEQQQLLQQQGAAAAAVAKAGGCQGAAASAACDDSNQLAGAGFKVAQAPCESSFAHMFDFY
jgi:hypothetical protein